MQSSIGQQLDEGSVKVTEGQRQVQACFNSFKQIQTAMDELKTISGEIAVASAEQSKGIDEINKAISLIDQGSQRNNASAEGMGHIAGDFQTLADNLDSIVLQLLQTLTGIRQSPSRIFAGVAQAVPKKNEKNRAAEKAA